MFLSNLLNWPSRQVLAGLSSLSTNVYESSIVYETSIWMRGTPQERLGNVVLYPLPFYWFKKFYVTNSFQLLFILHSINQAKPKIKVNNWEFFKTENFLNFIFPVDSLVGGSMSIFVEEYNLMLSFIKELICLNVRLYVCLSIHRSQCHNERTSSSRCDWHN